MEEILGQFLNGGSFNFTYILVLVGAGISFLASMGVKTAYARYSQIPAKSKLSGALVAETILRKNGISDVRVGHVRGELSDHYDPGKKLVNLSDAVYDKTSLAAISVAAHECGHVMQHYKGYIPLKIRTLLVPVATFGSNAGLLILGGSLGFGLSPMLATIGGVLFSLGILFQIVTLPVEFDASRRALIMLREYNILSQEEISPAQKVLKAAALTYVAAVVNAILQLIRLIAIAKSRGRMR